MSLAIEIFALTIRCSRLVIVVNIYLQQGTTVPVLVGCLKKLKVAERRRLAKDVRGAFLILSLLEHCPHLQFRVCFFVLCVRVPTTTSDQSFVLFSRPARPCFGWFQ
mgnify:CR=1 FL=1